MGGEPESLTKLRAILKASEGTPGQFLSRLEVDLVVILRDRLDIKKLPRRLRKKAREIIEWGECGSLTLGEIAEICSIANVCPRVITHEMYKGILDATLHAAHNTHGGSQ